MSYYNWHVSINSSPKEKKTYLGSLANASTIYENFEFVTLTNPKHRNRNRLYGFKISQKAIKPITVLSII